MELNTTTTKLLITILIIIAGYVVIRIGSSIIISLSKRKETISVKHIQIVKVFRYLVMIFTILAALIYLQVDLVKDITVMRDFISNTYNLLPNILLVILLIVLAISVVTLITFGFR